MIGKRTAWGFMICLLAGFQSAWAGPGSEAYNEYLDKEVIYQNEDWQEYVTEIGERLLAVSPHAGRDYAFVVTDQPFVNASA